MENSTDEEKAHEILLQHQFNENRLIGERTSLFALATSVLFIAFAMLVPLSKIVCTVLAAVGLVYCLAIWGALRASVRALDFWFMGQRQIEEEGGGCFAYMRENCLSPQIHGSNSWEKGLAKSWKLYPHIAWFVCAVWAAALVYLWWLS